MENTRPYVFIVDDNITNLMTGKTALSPVYNVLTQNSCARMLKALTKITPALILLDVEMPEVDGFEAIKILKADPATASIPVVFLSARDDRESEQIGLSLGATGYIKKPFKPSGLLAYVEKLLPLDI